MTAAPMTAGEVKGFRTSQKLTQAAFASALGASISTIQDWEAGKYKPPLMLRLACAAIAAGLAPWSTAALPVEIEIEAVGESLPGIIAQIVSLRQDGYEPATLTLDPRFWRDLARSALATPFEHLVVDVPGRRELASVAIDLDGDARTPAFTCRRLA